MKKFLGFAVACLVVSLAHGESRGEDGSRQPGVTVEKRGNATNITVAGSEAWQGVMTAILALRQIPRERDAEVIADLRRRMDDLPPAYIYELARRTCATDAGEASYLFNLAGARMRYDAARCVDPSAAAGVQATLYSLQTPDFGRCLSEDLIVQSLRKLVGSDAPFSSHASPWWICSHGMAATIAGLDHKQLAQDDWLKPEADWPGARKMVEDSFTYTLGKHDRK